MLRLGKYLQHLYTYALYHRYTLLIVAECCSSFDGWGRQRLPYQCCASFRLVNDALLQNVYRTSLGEAARVRIHRQSGRTATFFFFFFFFFTWGKCITHTRRDVVCRVVWDSLRVSVPQVYPLKTTTTPLNHLNSKFWKDITINK